MADFRTDRLEVEFDYWSVVISLWPTDECMRYLMITQEVLSAKKEPSAGRGSHLESSLSTKIIGFAKALRDNSDKHAKPDIHYPIHYKLNPS